MIYFLLFKLVCHEWHITMEEFRYKVDEAGDFKIIRYQIPGWDQLTDQQKDLIFCLYNASMWGRDITWDQNFKYGIYIRQVLEAILEENWFSGPTELTEDNEWEPFMDYTKLMYIGNGVYHPHSGEKNTPAFSKQYFIKLMNTIKVPNPPPGCDLLEILFNPTVFPMRVNKKKGDDIVQTSAVNFYTAVTQAEAEQFYKAKEAQKGEHPEGVPLPYGMNSQLVRTTGMGAHAETDLMERTWRVHGMYGPALSKIIEWLTKAIDVAENDKQAESFRALIKFYTSGSLVDFNDYCIKWLDDKESTIDIIHGFIEDYTDPLNRKCTYEAILSVCDPEQSKRIKMLQDHGQWFEDNSPTDKKYKKEKVVGIDARVINVAALAGDASPCPPIGVNLPNGKELREKYGSKAINLDNIVNAYDNVRKDAGAADEFFLPQIANLRNLHGEYMDKIHTDMHEVLGHGSGRVLPGVGDLGSYSGVIEETRADLFGLYHVMSPKCVEIGLVPCKEAAQNTYDVQMTNGLISQLIRLKPHETTLKQTHMRNRQLIAAWSMEKAQESDPPAVEFVHVDESTYVKINDYEALQEIYGQLLKEIQRITSEGDKEAAEDLVETYATQVDEEIHKEALERWAKYEIKPYSAFINPKITDQGAVIYPDDFLDQQYGYSRDFASL
jgi:dipeptidyl-peptidase III